MIDNSCTPIPVEQRFDLFETDRLDLYFRQKFTRNTTMSGISQIEAGNLFNVKGLVAVVTGGGSGLSNQSGPLPCSKHRWTCMRCLHRFLYTHR